jgi:hypothetical protein
MVLSVLVFMAVDGGQLKSAADVDKLMRQLVLSRGGCGHHRDQTYRELEDALLDARTFLISKAQLAALVSTVEPTPA